MKKILVLSFLLISYINLTFADLSPDELKPTKEIKTPITSADNANLSDVFIWLKSQLNIIVFVIAIIVFVIIGARMILARGNPEEFKKAWFQFIYAVVGVFFVFAALGLVRIIYDLSINFKT